MQENEYERLVREGYIEAGTLVIHVDDITTLDLSTEEVKPEGMSGKQREDKKVVLIDKQGRMKRVSSLMFGYNKKKVQLADGSFVNSVELLEAIQKAVSDLDKGSVVVTRKGKFLNPEELMSMAVEAAGLVRVGEKSDKVTNQDTRTWGVRGAHSDVEYSKGTVFLGNDGVQLPTGEYISLDEILKALNDYIVMKPGEIAPIPPVPGSKDPNPGGKDPKPRDSRKDPIVVRVVRKYKNRLSAWLAFLAALLVILSGFKMTDNIKTIEVPVEMQQYVVEYITQNDLNYDIQELGIEQVYETIEQARKSFIMNAEMGDSIALQEGDTFYENSVLQGSQAVIGSQYRPAGAYQITGISVVYNGVIKGSLVDLTLQNPGVSIADFVNETCAKFGISVDDVDLRIHMGSSSNYTQTGWNDIQSIIQDGEVSQDVISEISVVKSTYDGVVHDFNGDSITINGVNGPVTLKVIDANGNLVQPGTTVIGSDGKEYIVSGLELESQTKAVRNSITETVMVETEVKDGKKLTWRVQDCDLTLALAPLLGALAAAEATRKKNAESQAKPSLFEFENEVEYLKFKEDFEKAREKYEKTSGFKRMLKDIFYRKEVDLLQRLTNEQIQQLYSVIRKSHSGDYSYNPGDKINFKNGRVIITFVDGRTQDITDIVMPAIAQIGKDNEVITEGLLEEEQLNGVRRR